MPKVSVIVPIYGVEKYLVEALDSLMAQTLDDIEFLLIDDGSKDNCASIIDEYAKKDVRFKAFHKQNSGYGATCNFGIEKAQGEYIAIFEPDDYIDKNMYQELYNLAIKDDCDIVKSSFFENLDTKKEKNVKKINWDKAIESSEKPFEITEKPIFLSLHPSVWSAIYKKDFIQENNIRFVEAPGAGWSDNPFQVQTLCLAKKITYTQKAYYYWRISSRYPSDELKDYTIVFDRHNDIYKWLNDKNITDKRILSNLYKRELIYMDIVLGMKKISDKNDCFARIKKAIDRMNSEIIFDLNYCSKKDRKKYNLLKKPQLARLYQLYKRYKNLFIFFKR